MSCVLTDSIEVPDPSKTTTGSPCWIICGYRMQKSVWELGFFQQWCKDGNEALVVKVTDGLVYRMNSAAIAFCRECPWLPE